MIWEEVSNKGYLFDRNVLVARALSDVTVDDVKRFFDCYVGPGGSERTKFSSMFYGAQFKIPKVSEFEGAVRNITNPVRFKRSMPLASVVEFLPVAIAETKV